MKKTTTQTSNLPRHAVRERGFTLIELLVVIVIIAVLATIAVVSTGKIRSKAQQANAMNSMRQVVAFNVAYSTENNGNINTLRWVGDPKEGGGGAWVSNSFWGRLQPYLFPNATSTNQPKLKNEIKQELDNLFSTTNASTMAGTILSGARIYHDGSGLPVPFAFNTNLHKWNEFIKVSKFGNPSQILYLTYGFGLFTEADGKAYEPMPKDRSTPRNKIYYQEDKRMLAAFLDGHVDWISPPIPARNFQ